MGKLTMILFFIVVLNHPDLSSDCDIIDIISDQNTSYDKQSIPSGFYSLYKKRNGRRLQIISSDSDFNSTDLRRSNGSGKLIFSGKKGQMGFVFLQVPGPGLGKSVLLYNLSTASLHEYSVKPIVSSPKELRDDIRTRLECN